MATGELISSYSPYSLHACRAWGVAVNVGSDDVACSCRCSIQLLGQPQKRTNLSRFRPKSAPRFRHLLGLCRILRLGLFSLVRLENLYASTLGVQVELCLVKIHAVCFPPFTPFLCFENIKNALSLREKPSCFKDFLLLTNIEIIHVFD